MNSAKNRQILISRAGTIFALLFCCVVVLCGCASNHKARVLLNYTDDGSGQSPVKEYTVVQEYDNVYGKLKLHGMLVDKDNKPVRYNWFLMQTGSGNKKELYSNHKGEFNAEFVLNRYDLQNGTGFNLLFVGSDISKINYSFPFTRGKVYKKGSTRPSSLPAEGDMIVINVME